MDIDASILLNGVQSGEAGQPAAWLCAQQNPWYVLLPHYSLPMRSPRMRDHNATLPLRREICRYFVGYCAETVSEYDSVCPIRIKIKSAGKFLQYIAGIYEPIA